MRLHFENNIFVVSRSSHGWPFAFSHLETLVWFYNKIDDVFTEVPVIVWGQKHILIVLIAPVGIICHMS